MKILKEILQELIQIRKELQFIRTSMGDKKFRVDGKRVSREMAEKRYKFPSTQPVYEEWHGDFENRDAMGIRHKREGKGQRK